ncbi:MAG: hypothetical protein JF606_27665, partial [Burkholderiales bacterium]|nr:hypothetical protein [Burkholderiales bacterium]
MPSNRGDALGKIRARDRRIQRETNPTPTHQLDGLLERVRERKWHGSRPSLGDALCIELIATRLPAEIINTVRYMTALKDFAAWLQNNKPREISTLIQFARAKETHAFDIREKFINKEIEHRSQSLVRGCIRKLGELSHEDLAYLDVLSAVNVRRSSTGAEQLERFLQKARDRTWHKGRPSPDDGACIELVLAKIPSPRNYSNKLRDFAAWLRESKPNGIRTLLEFSRLEVPRSSELREAFLKEEPEDTKYSRRVIDELGKLSEADIAWLASQDWSGNSAVNVRKSLTGAEQLERFLQKARDRTWANGRPSPDDGACIELVLAEFSSPHHYSPRLRDFAAWLREVKPNGICTLLEYARLEASQIWELREDFLKAAPQNSRRAIDELSKLSKEDIAWLESQDWTAQESSRRRPSGGASEAGAGRSGKGSGRASRARASGTHPPIDSGQVTFADPGSTQFPGARGLPPPPSPAASFFAGVEDELQRRGPPASMQPPATPGYWGGDFFNAAESL